MICVSGTRIMMLANSQWYSNVTNWYQNDGGPLQYTNYTQDDGSYGQPGLGLRQLANGGHVFHQLF